MIREYQTPPIQVLFNIQCIHHQNSIEHTILGNPGVINSVPTAFNAVGT